MIKTINIKEFNPPVDVALSLLSTEIELCKLEKIKVLKVIHGYGSTGVGGEIKKSMVAMLKLLKHKGVIIDYLLGEHFCDGNKNYASIVEEYPQAIIEPEITCLNSGITFIICC